MHTGHHYHPHVPVQDVLPITSQSLYLFQRIRDEAHRFANTYQAQVRDKKTTRSVLDDIPGIGPRRRKALQLHFGSVTKMRAATAAELVKVPGMNPKLAEVVFDFLHDATRA